MGEAKRRQEREAEIITFDFSAPDYAMASFMKELERTGGTTTKEQAKVRATSLTIGQIVEAKYGQKMKRNEGKIWATWLESLDELEESKGSSKVEMARGQIDWLFNILIDSDVTIPTAMAQWREALVIYIEALRSKPALSIAKE